MNKTTKFPLKMTIPPDRASVPWLALPNRQWRKTADGGIEVVFNNPAQLRDCLEATKEIRKGMQ